MSKSDDSSDDAGLSPIPKKKSRPNPIPSGRTPAAAAAATSGSDQISAAPVDASQRPVVQTKATAKIPPSPLKKNVSQNKNSGANTIEEAKEKVKDKLLKRKAVGSGARAVILSYAEDKFILEHEKKTEAKNESSPTPAVDEVEGTPTAKLRKPSGSPDKSGGKTKSKSTRTTRGRGGRLGPRGRTWTRNRLETSESDSSDSESPERTILTKKVAKRSRVSPTKSTASTSKLTSRTPPPAASTPIPKNRPLSFQEVMELSKANLVMTKSEPKHGSSRKRANESNLKAAAAAAPADKRFKRKSATEEDIELSKLVKELRLESGGGPGTATPADAAGVRISKGRKINTRGVKRVSFNLAEDSPAAKMLSLKQRLNHEERNFVRNGHCFLVRNYREVRSHRREMLNRGLVKRFLVVNSSTGFTKEQRLVMTKNLHKISGKMRNSARWIPLNLSQPIPELTPEERQIVVDERVFLFRNLKQGQRGIKANFYWNPKMLRPKRYAGNSVKIPENIFAPMRAEPLNNAEIGDETVLL